MELRDNNTRKLTSGLRRPFGVAGNPLLSFFLRVSRSSPLPWIRAAVECWTAGWLLYKLFCWREKKKMYSFFSAWVQVPIQLRVFAPQASGANCIFGLKVDPVSWRRPWPTCSSWRETSHWRVAGFLDLAIDRFRNEFTQNGPRDEKVEGAESPERTEFSSNRGLLSCGRVLWFCSVFGDSTSKGSDEFSLWRGEESVPRTSWLRHVLQCHSQFSPFGKWFSPRFGGCSGVSFRRPLFLPVLSVVLGIYINRYVRKFFLSDTSLDFLYEQRWKDSLPGLQGNSGLSFV